MKFKDILKTTDNPTVYNRAKRQEFRCPLCPPNKCENAKRHSKHGNKKPKKKNKRK